MRYLLTCALLLGCWGLSWGQGQVARLEYFVDTDPGLGQATAVGITPGAAISPGFVVPLATVSQGFHTLYVRARDGQGRWSHTSQQAFYTTVLAPATQALTQAEYFIDQEPGLGQGTAIGGLAAGQASTTVAFNVGLSAVSQGFHTLYLRTRDAQGAWSHTSQQAFYVLSQAAGSQALARAEYFIDQDPGQGLGTAVPLPAGQPATATLAFNVPLASVSTGAHTLYLRVADKGRAWSHTSQQAFWVKPGGGLATITAFEYYFTGTGANASYTSATLRYAVPTPAASVSLNFAADLSQLPGNADYDMHIRAVSSEGLRSLVQTKRVRACNSLPVKAGFDLAQDGRQVYFVNQSTNADRYRWSFGDGTTDTTANPLHTYAAIGNYPVQLISRSFCNPDTITKVVSILGLKDITTNHGGNTGAASVVVTGAGFVPGMQLKLQRAGQADIVGDTVITRSAGVLTTGFNLTGKAIGQWDVVATYPSGVSVNLPNGFTVELGIAHKLSVSITGPSALRVGFQQVYTISCTNYSNVDANYFPLVFRGLPIGTNIRMLSRLVSPDSIAGLDTLGVSSVSLPSTYADSARNESFKVFIINKLVASSTSILSFVIQVPASTPIGTNLKLQVAIGNPIANFYANFRFSSANDCYAGLVSKGQEKAIEIAAGLVPKVTDFTGVSTCINGIKGIIDNKFKKYIPTEDAINTTIDNAAYAYTIYKTSLGCTRVAMTAVGVLAPIFAGFAGVSLSILAVSVNTRLLAIEKASDRVASILDAADLFVDCSPLFGRPNKAFHSATVAGASDPNAKYGPGGGSAHHYINKAGPLPYTIAFENLPTANLSAQTVRVTDTLSAQAFNLGTFAFTSVTVGEKTYALPVPAKSFVHDFDFVAQHGVKARVVGTFDAATGIVRWTFFSIDPATNQVTTNVLAGFLPPDVVSPRGQGYVSFTVQANPARQTGDVIHNRASIVFDYNPPILTNDWHNTFDLVPPSSAVTSVTATPADSVFHVNWSGTDVGSAIQGYDIVYTVNGRNPRNWLVGTSATTALFTGRRDSTYCFYSVARDSAGNVEAAPLAPDVCKSLVVLSQQPAAGAVPDGFTVYPNPTPGVFTVETQAVKPEQSSLQVEDVMGRVVYRASMRLGGGIQRREVDIRPLAAGIYFVKMSVDGRTTVRKLVKN